MHTTDFEAKAELTENNGFSPEQAEHISSLLGRSPNALELSIFAVIWSGPQLSNYAQKWLKTLPQFGRPLLNGPEEELGKIIDLDNGQACVIKLESFNHPSIASSSFAVIKNSPVDFISMGAHPAGHYLTSFAGTTGTFGSEEKNIETTPDTTLNNSLNQLPLLGQKCYVHEIFEQNGIVNDLSLGIVELDKRRAEISDEIAAQIYLFEIRAESRNPNEDDDSAETPRKSTLDGLLLKKVKDGKIHWLDELENYGIAFTLAKWSMNSGKGISVNLDKLTRNDKEVSLQELLASEMPQKMLLIGQLNDEQEAVEFFEKLNGDYCNIGEVTESGKLEYFSQGEQVIEIPSNSMSLRLNSEPFFERESLTPEYLKKVKRFNLNQIKVPKSFKEVAQKMYAAPSLSHKSNAIENEGDLEALLGRGPSDAIRLRCVESEIPLLIATECNVQYVYSDPYLGACIALANAIRQIICTGGIPLAVFNFLNFEDLENPISRFQFTNVIKGLGDACRKFGILVANSEVNIYSDNSSTDATNPAFPAPMVGILGTLENEELETTFDFKGEGDLIYMIGNANNELGSSVFIQYVHGVKFSPCPKFDLHEEFEVQSHVRNLIRKNIVVSAHGVSRGGLFACLLDSAKVRSLGFQIETVETFRKDCFLFGESQSRVVISISSKDEDELQNYLITSNVSFTKLGEVIGNLAIIDDENFGSINDWKTIFDNTFNKILEQ